MQFDIAFPPTHIDSSSHRGSYFTAGLLKACQVALVKPMIYLKRLIIRLINPLKLFIWRLKFHLNPQH
jgi:hypothetical protein